jgi:hypothetical protein
VKSCSAHAGIERSVSMTSSSSSSSIRDGIWTSGFDIDSVGVAKPGVSEVSTSLDGNQRSLRTHSNPSP